MLEAWRPNDKKDSYEQKSMWVTSCFCWKSSCCNVLRWPVCKQYALPPKDVVKGIKEPCKNKLQTQPRALSHCLSLIGQRRSSWGFPWILLGLDPGNPPLYKWPNFVPFYGWVKFHCISVPHLLYSFICHWTCRLFPSPGYCKYCCKEHWTTCVFSSYGFLRVYAHSGIAGSYGSSTFSFLRNLCIVLHGGWTFVGGPPSSCRSSITRISGLWKCLWVDICKDSQGQEWTSPSPLDSRWVRL